MEFARRRHRDNSFSRDTRKQTEARKRKREIGEEVLVFFFFRSSFNLNTAVSGTVESAQGRRTDPRLRLDLPRDDLAWFDLIGLLAVSQASPVKLFWNNRM